jgi:hypothetical protein
MVSQEEIEHYKRKYEHSHLAALTERIVRLEEKVAALEGERTTRSARTTIPIKSITKGKAPAPAKSPIDVYKAPKIGLPIAKFEKKASVQATPEPVSSKTSKKASKTH